MQVKRIRYSDNARYDIKVDSALNQHGEAT